VTPFPYLHLRGPEREFGRVRAQRIHYDRLVAYAATLPRACDGCGRGIWSSVRSVCPVRQLEAYRESRRTPW